MMGAILLMKDKAKGVHRLLSELDVGMLCRGHCFGNGLIMRAVGDRMIIAPAAGDDPRNQIDEMMALIRKLPGSHAGGCSRQGLGHVTR